MKKIITLLFSAALVSAVFAQSGDRHRNDSRSYDNSYPTLPYSNNNPYSYEDQYPNDDRYGNPGYYNRFESKRQRLARLRYEMMMRRSIEARYHNQRRYDMYSPYTSPRRPSVQIRIGIGGHSRY